MLGGWGSEYKNKREKKQKEMECSGFDVHKAWLFREGPDDLL